MVVAPLSANTLAKLANGLCDNLLVSKSFINIVAISINLPDLCFAGMGPAPSCFCGACHEYPDVDASVYLSASSSTGMLTIIRRIFQ
jgi:hypothetical protein